MYLLVIIKKTPLVMGNNQLISIKNEIIVEDSVAGFIN